MMTTCKSEHPQNQIRISQLEEKHSGDLRKIYEIYSLLRDYYTHYNKQKKNDNEIGVILSKKFNGEIYRTNRVFLREAYQTISELLKLYKRMSPSKNMDLATIGNIMSSIKGNIEFIKRIINILEEVVCAKNIDRLKREMELEKTDEQ